MYTLQEIAKKLDGYVKGDGSVKIASFATLEEAQQGQLSFLSNKKYALSLKQTQASAVLLDEAYAAECPTNAIVVNNPYLAFAKIAVLFDRTPKPKKSIHISAVISKTAKISDSACIAENVVIGDNVIINDNAIIGANCVISAYSSLGKNTELKPNVSIYHDVKIGDRCLIHANSVIGSDGFGNAKDDTGKWVKIPQIGGVTIGNDVEIGASTTIDRGAINDTIIHDGAKIDNQVQIAHNVTIGENTAVAAATGIAGSVDIGKNCLIGGQVGISGHLEICDNVALGAASNVSKSILKPGFYNGAFNARPHMEWKRANARIFKLDKLETRVKILEKDSKNKDINV